MIHEQYFYEDYVGYLPDFASRVLKSCELLFQKGYTGAHIDEVLRETPLQSSPAFHYR